MSPPSACASRDGRKAHYEGNKLAKRLRAAAGAAIADFRMIEEGDRILVCLSGGKDSHALLDILLRLREKAPVGFELVAFNLDQRQPGFPAEVLPAYLARLGIPFHIETRDTYSIVRRMIPEGRIACPLCSRLRRGIVYRVAGELGATKIALGHHRDDLLETLLLNLFHGGSLKAMAPKLLSDDGRHVVIRPLAYCRERDLAEYATLRGFPIIPCNLCGSRPDAQRRAVKELLRGWERRHPGRVENMFRALQHVVPSHLADRELFDFAALRARACAGEREGEPAPAGLLLP
ncbi:MAG: tRNA 2-thiocytidine(32) synthetase TtcA [Betaproteobacteria bacterium CG2_30_68_42]|nr:MAG: tRNA 2-thiocytidine(32) synthetase TtcA [Betaproteobacteria bacterium CG2_30_68_42]